LIQHLNIRQKKVKGKRLHLACVEILTKR